MNTKFFYTTDEHKEIIKRNGFIFVRMSGGSHAIYVKMWKGVEVTITFVEGHESNNKTFHKMCRECKLKYGYEMDFMVLDKRYWKMNKAKFI